LTAAAKTKITASRVNSIHVTLTWMKNSLENDIIVAKCKDDFSNKQLATADAFISS
jgi:hypothetical protein